MCWPGGDDDANLRITSATQLDKATEARQLGLWNQAQQYAATDPFQSQYGGASKLGLSRMSQAGQRYTTESILGKGPADPVTGVPGAEQYDIRNLGFEGYERPVDAPTSPQWGYTPFAGGWWPPPSKSTIQPTGTGPGVGLRDDSRTLPPGFTKEKTFEGGVFKSVADPGFYSDPMAAARISEPPPPFASSPPPPPTPVVKPTGLLGTRAEEEAARGPGRLYSPTVGVREMEEAGDVTRRMLREVEPGTPGYKEFLTGGWTKQDEAGIGETPGFELDVDGNLVPIKGFGFSGAELEGPTIDPVTGDVTDTGYRPAYDAISGTVGEDGAAPFGVTERDPFTFGSIDPDTGLPRVDPITGFPIGDVPAVTQGLISTQTGYGDEAIGQRPVLDADGNPVLNDDGTPMMESALSMTEAQRELSQIGRVESDQQVFDPDTQRVRSAAERITGGDISPIGQFRDAEGLVTDVMTPGAVEDPTLKAPTTKVAYDALSKTAFDVDAPEGLWGEAGFTGVAGEKTTDVAAVTPTAIGGPSGVTVDPVTGQMAAAMGGVTPGAIAGPGGVAVDPVTGQVTQAVGGVTPGEFGGASFFGGPEMADYMNVAGVEASVTQARQDYEIALNREKARQAQVGAFGARGTVEEAGLIAAQERNIAQIRGAGYERAAQLMESDAARRQQAGLQGQQLDVETGLAGQSLEAQRRESDAARAQQAAMAGQQLDFAGQLQTQQLAQAGDIRGAELGLQASMQGQQLEAQRRSEDAARIQQAALAGQQLKTQAQMQTEQLTQAGGIRGAELGLQAGLQGQQLQAQRREADAARAQQAALAGQALEFEGGMQTQRVGLEAGMQTAQNQLAAAQANQQAALQTGSETQRMEAQRQVDQAQMRLAAQQQTQALGFEGGMRAQQLGQQADIRQAELDMEAARANQATALTSGSQTQQIQASRQMRQAELNLQRQQQTQALGLEAGMQQAGFGQQAAVRQTELDLQREQATQGLGAEAFMQQQQLGQQASMATASNALAAAQSDQQAALASGNQAAALEAARRAQGAQAQMDIARQTQALGAGAAAQQAQLEATRRQRLSEMGLQAGGMGMDAQAQFRDQQMAAAQQLADIGGMRQGATFGAGEQLAGMGARQEQARTMQQAWDYEQWLRGQEGGAESLGLIQALMPGGRQEQWQRGPDRFGQLIGLASTAVGAYGAAKGSDIRIKDNIKYAGVKNGFNLYEFNYLGGNKRYRGVMAQEVMKQRPDAVESRNGVYWVNYDALDIQLEAV